MCMHICTHVYTQVDMSTHMFMYTPMYTLSIGQTPCSLQCMVTSIYMSMHLYGRVNRPADRRVYGNGKDTCIDMYMGVW